MCDEMSSCHDGRMTALFVSVQRLCLRSVPVHDGPCGQDVPQALDACHLWLQLDPIRQPECVFRIVSGHDQQQQAEPLRQVGRKSLQPPSQGVFLDRPIDKCTWIDPLTSVVSCVFSFIGPIFSPYPFRFNATQALLLDILLILPRLMESVISPPMGGWGADVYIHSQSFIWIFITAWVIYGIFRSAVIWYCHPHPLTDPPNPHLPLLPIMSTSSSSSITPVLSPKPSLIS